MIEYLSDHFTVFAPDTPGNGLSDPLPLDAPTMDDYGDNVARVLDALGIDRIALYGFHTGASVGTAFAIRHPQRVLGAILDGFLVESDASLQDRLTHYLVSFEPKLDGSHMTWLWTRLRDQGLYGKWYAPSLASRLDREPPASAATQATVMDWLDAGAAYIKPYAAAFRQRGHLQVMRFVTPTVLCAADSDSLVHHLDALPRSLPACVSVKRCGAKENQNAFALDELRRLSRRCGLSMIGPGRTMSRSPAASCMCGASTGRAGRLSSCMTRSVTIASSMESRAASEATARRSPSTCRVMAIPTTCCAPPPILPTTRDR